MDFEYLHVVLADASHNAKLCLSTNHVVNCPAFLFTSNCLISGSLSNCVGNTNTSGISEQNTSKSFPSNHLHLLSSASTLAPPYPKLWWCKGDAEVEQRWLPGKPTTGLTFYNDLTKLTRPTRFEREPHISLQPSPSSLFISFLMQKQKAPSGDGAVCIQAG